MPLLVLDQKRLILSSISYINMTGWCADLYYLRKIASSRLAWATLETLFQEESYISIRLQVLQVLKVISESRPRNAYNDGTAPTSISSEVYSLKLH